MKFPEHEGSQTKSRARMARAEVTTVRVMARDTPSAVGTES